MLRILPKQALTTITLIWKVVRGFRKGGTSKTIAPFSCPNLQCSGQTNHVIVVFWSILSPDIDPRENLYGRLTRNVCAKRCEFGTGQDPNLLFERSWFPLNSKLLQFVLLNMTDRVFEVIRTNGLKF